MAKLHALVALAAVASAVPAPAPQFNFGGGAGSGTLLRFGCSQIVIERLDPLVNSGQAPSPHMHQIIGGNAFNTSMPYSDISQLATCTTCSFTDDLSNYWTANLYFRAKNGSYKRVPQVPNRLLFGDRFTTQTNGGVTVYYTSPGPGKVTAFKPGFRMLTGDAASRSKVGTGRKSQSCFRCFTGPNHRGDNAAPCADSRLDFEELPPQACAGGIRSNVLYPTCWDGKNLDSPNHQDHVAYPVTGALTFMNSFSANFQCPESHPVRLPQLMLEIIWDTTPFNDPAEWPEDGSQPFVLSTGDTTGYSQHGDYVFGWKDDSLQRAMDGGCLGASCVNLKTQAIGTANNCIKAQTVVDDIDAWLPALPGDAGMPM